MSVSAVSESNRVRSYPTHAVYFTNPDSSRVLSIHQSDTLRGKKRRTISKPYSELTAVRDVLSERPQRQIVVVRVWVATRVVQESNLGALALWRNPGNVKGAALRRPWFIARAFTESVRSLAV